MRLPILGLFLLFSCSSPKEAARHPKDDELVAVFASHRPEFEQLLGVFRAKPRLSKITNEGYGENLEDERRLRWSEPYMLPEPERTNYRETLGKLDVQEVVRRIDGSIIFVVSERSSFFFDESAKGYEYSDSAQTPQVRSLDTVNLGCGEMFYRLLEGKWSLYLQSYCS